MNRSNKVEIHPMNDILFSQRLTLSAAADYPSGAL